MSRDFSKICAAQFPGWDVVNIQKPNRIPLKCRAEALKNGIRVGRNNGDYIGHACKGPICAT